ncbi:MAG: hypothetical protein C0483_20545 [Pirellula sp.]|nr:hypothetical protein [Pirellula sp.]
MQATFEDWGSYPTGYCLDCDAVNAVLEVPAVEEFSPPAEVGDNYNFWSEVPPCDLTDGTTPGYGCRYEAEWEFDCVPEPCTADCMSDCGGFCTTDADCEPESCGDLRSCGATDPSCEGYGGPCTVVCEQASVCVFDEETDPDHEHGYCASVGDCTASVEPNSCAPLRLRLRALLYVSAERRGVLSVQVILFCRTAVGELTAVQLGGVYEFDDEELDCGTIDVDVPLSPVVNYGQPLVPACGPATFVRITSLS